MNALKNPPEGYREALGSISEAAATHRASAEVKSQLLAAFREQPPAVPRKAHMRAWGPYMFGAIAAGLLLWFALTARRPAEITVRHPMTSNFTPEEPVMVVTRIPLKKPEVEVTARGRSPRRSRASRPRALPEEAMPFLPVPYGDAMAPSDGAEVVRVQLPRSALLDFGFPVDELRMAEKIQADVLLSEDGSVRAVRFLR